MRLAMSSRVVAAMRVIDDGGMAHAEGGLCMVQCAG